MLSADDVSGLRAVLDAGKRPKVMFSPSAGQMAGQLGQVVRLEDPAVDPEFVVVRFGKDELGFSPTDLMVPPKRTPGPREPAVPVRDAANVTESRPPLSGPPLLPPAPKTPPRAARPVEESAIVDNPETTAAPRKPARAKAPKAPVELTVTLTCQEGQWSVQAARGAKVVAKPSPVRAPDALAMVASLDVPAVREAVEELVYAARLAAEEEAERLRRQLAEVEARLAELPA